MGDILIQKFFDFVFTKRNPCGRIIRSQPLLAQLDRVPDSDSDGRRFESCRVGHKQKQSRKGLFLFAVRQVRSCVQE